MTLLSRSLTTIGALLLAHACYSAQESSAYQKASLADSSSSPPSNTSTTTSASNPSLPLDIILETILSVLIICVGLVLGSPALRPISWRIWAGEIERKRIEGADSGDASGVNVNPFASLESRVGFGDIRAKRSEFERWIRERDAAVKS